MKTLLAILTATLLSGCYKEASKTTNNYEIPSNSIYESGDLGQINIAGAPTEAKARFTFNGDEYPISVNVQGDYVPAVAGVAPAIVEVSLYDTKGDSDATNDVLIGVLPISSPWSRARLDSDFPGSFAVNVPIGSATNEKLGPQVVTLGVRLRISTTSWYGSITSWEIKIVTMRGLENRLVPNSFHRDQ